MGDKTKRKFLEMDENIRRFSVKLERIRKKLKIKW